MERKKMYEQPVQSEPLVSAVVITHNRKKLVQGAIASVLNQTYKNIELFVVDDASEDGTKELMEKKAAADIFTYIYIPKSESKGGNHARNVGIRMSKGEYVAFLDDDDEWLPEKIEKQVEFLQNHPECGVVACFNIVEFDFKDRYPENRDGMMEGDLHERIFSWNPFCTSVAMYRRSVLEEAGMFDENLKYWQEVDLNIRVAQIAEFGCVHEELGLYRVVKKDKNRLTNQLEGWMKAIRYIEKKHRKLIRKLPEDIYRKHRLLIAGDGATRAFINGNKKMERKFLLEVFRLEPSVKNLAKLVLGVSGYNKARDFKNSLIRKK